MVIYEYRWIWEVMWASELDAANLDLQLHQPNGIWSRAEVLPGVMTRKHNLSPVGHGDPADAG